MPGPTHVKVSASRSPEHLVVMTEQTGGPKLFLQTLQALRPTASVQAEGAGVPAGAEGAADIVSGSFCHPESIDATIECTSYAEVLR